MSVVRRSRSRQFSVSYAFVVARSQRAAALAHLKMKKTQISQPHSGVPPASSSSTIDPSTMPFVAPPAQSRDATATSRYFPMTPGRHGTVLVPSSSPLNPDAQHRSNTSYRPYNSYDVAHAPNAGYSAGWGAVNGGFGADPLSAPSGFTSQNGVSHASLPRQRGDSGRAMADGEGRGGDGPSRKRMRGPSQEIVDVMQSPESPDIRPPGQRRHLVHALSNESEESLPDVHGIFDSPTTPQIPLRGQSNPRDSPLPTASPTVEDVKFKRFAMTMPMHSPKTVLFAWQQSNGDTREASNLLQDQAWLRNPSGVTQSTPEPVGRVKAVDDAHKAQRAATREMGKNSLIYANRPNLLVPPQAAATPAKKVSPIPLQSPLSPDVSRPRIKRAKKVIESDSEEASENEHDAKRQKLELEQSRALDYYNTAAAEGLQELTGCTPVQALKIIEQRPFADVDDLKDKLGQGRKKAGPGGISPRMFDDSANIFKGYGAVDGILEECEKLGASLRDIIASWSANTKGKGKDDGQSSSRNSPALSVIEDGALSLVDLDAVQKHTSKDFLVSQPSTLSEGTRLKDYQLLGVNWLNLLYSKGLSCILADEMGLGKTIQVISFFAHLKQQGSRGPHLVVVPSSTLENWLREFKNFAPTISVVPYYAGKEERPRLRQELLETLASTRRDGNGWEVLITTYNLAQGDERDRKFFKRIEWDTCVFDEGHVLKNFQSQRYQTLIKYGSKWRLLLTGTPLQNNLQELVSLMNFILPSHFAEEMESLRAIFKVKGDSKISMLAQERVSRAKKMMTPFVLRRRKDQVAKDLPKKVERIEWCGMTDLQKTIYNDALQRSRKTICEAETTGASTPVEKEVEKGKKAIPKKKTKAAARPKDKVYAENSSNVLMDLRKASSHPMLFRRRFSDQTLSAVTKLLLKEPDFKKRGAVYEYVKEDMQVMTDAELQLFFAQYKATSKYLLHDDCYLEAGKVTVLLKLLEGYIAQGRKVLVFSQFTQILDIVKAVLKKQDINYLILTGSTPVDVRQSLVDQFSQDESMSLPVFLLSTKAGGMGLNLTAASAVILFDQDFNPHNDKQAQDRAYRIGQKRDVDVVRLITKGTIEEDMLKLGQTKLALDDAVAGDTEESGTTGESAPEREMKTSLMNVLRKQLEQQNGEDATIAPAVETNAEARIVEVEMADGTVAST
ncbi:hypothetical protein HWV62_14392 [Athelia sp. TMB]|nr:hypothetical protein HWV62_14392 [Athelia sp. TMB]